MVNDQKVNNPDQFYDTIFNLRKLNVFSLNLDLNSQDSLEAYFSIIKSKKPESLVFDEVKLYSSKAVEYTKEWVYTLNGLNFNLVNLNIVMDSPTAVNILDELHKINEANLKVNIVYESEISKQIFDRFQTITNVKVNKLTLNFVDGYKAGFLTELIKWPKRPSLIITILSCGFRFNDYFKVYTKDLDELVSAGLDIV